MKLLGHNTIILENEISLSTAEKEYPQWFAVVFDPIRSGITITAGSVRAVSKTNDGAYRALDQLGQTHRKVTVFQLK